MRTLGTLVLLALLTACAGDSPRAPVEDRYGEQVGQDELVPDTYKVKRGDTLFAIAWRYGFDFRGLASANSIVEPYTIYPGQTLRLRETKQVTSAGPPSSQANTAAPPAPATTAQQAPEKSSSPVSSPARSVASAPRVAAGGSGAAVGKWRWPTRGKVVRGFSGTVHKGVDIDGKSGDPVYAVADGNVVYAGSGIVGYGRLLIVKHNDIYLSAYGHNRALLVSEGSRVTAGQKIAEKGSSATNSVKLHFEIRREGRPVDPLALLPPR
jgi:lipoprotein NlpD